MPHQANRGEEESTGGTITYNWLDGTYFKKN